MNEKLVDALEKLIDYERISTNFYQGRQIQMNWKLNTIRRVINYQTNENEAYCDGFPDELVDFIVHDVESEDNLLNCIKYISEYVEPIEVSDIDVSQYL